MKTDFSLTYEWVAGTMPPPDHYEYTIHIGPKTAGEILFQPDYANFDPPIWREQFELSEEGLEKLIHLIQDAALDQQQWTIPTPAPVGGSRSWLTIHIDGQQITVPAKIKERSLVQPIYQAIKQLVPTAVWQQLHHKQAQFQKRYGQDNE